MLRRSQQIACREVEGSYLRDKKFQINDRRTLNAANCGWHLQIERCDVGRRSSALGGAMLSLPEIQDHLAQSRSTNHGGSTVGSVWTGGNSSGAESGSGRKGRDAGIRRFQWRSGRADSRRMGQEYLVSSGVRWQYAAGFIAAKVASQQLPDSYLGDGGYQVGQPSVRTYHNHCR